MGYFWKSTKVSMPFRKDSGMFHENILNVKECNFSYVSLLTLNIWAS